MTDAFARPVEIVDGQIDTLRSLNADATQQLANLHRQMAELERHELNLISVIDGRQRRIDLLLDERLRARASEAEKVTA